ncbi:PQQ-dependent sugar dehydrogenase [Zhongshania arctica]|uniref:PQQ-dependent sugar dehydrogenase n=1 Tax=Zhongshania arctica TaxID=3238302 RepID=A0ABV3U138_9GAMM
MRILRSIIYVLIVLMATPFLLVHYGPSGVATTSKVALNALFGYGGDEPSADIVRQQLDVADGFRLDLYATGLGKIRFMYATEAGDILVSRPRSGEVLILKADANRDGSPDDVSVLLSDLTRPHGIDYLNGWLYVAESNAVGRIAFDAVSGRVSGVYTRVVTGLGDKGNHWTKTLRAGSDGWLYLSSGSTCNVCEEEDPQRASVMRFKPDGSELSIYATGLRNSVGLDWAPWSNELFGTDNGRDLLGDDFPPCELNNIVEGGFYGWPYINTSTLDPDYGDKLPKDSPENLLPAHEFKAHNAPLGIRFLRHSAVAGFERSALVALHGSWNRSVPDGYKVVVLKWQPDGTIIESDFVSGFLQNGNLLGRPVDVTEARDGTIYISDDYSGSIYRVLPDDGLESSFTLPAAVQQVDADVGVLDGYDEQKRASLAAQGAQLYQQFNCAACHQPASRMALKTLGERYNAASLADFFSAPTPPMPAFPLSAEQREAMAVYLFDQELKAAH